MSVKDAGENPDHHAHHGHERKKMYRRVFFFFAGFIFIVLLIILLIWLILRPTMPKFYLEDTYIRAFNVSGAAAAGLTMTLQITLSSRNPNSRIGVQYDKLDCYAVYMSQQITLPTAIPPTYQGHRDVVMWSPVLYGVNVPIASRASTSIAQEESSGVLLLYVKVDGQLRWKVGSWTSGRYQIFVSCPAILAFPGAAAAGSGGGNLPAVLYHQTSTCSVDV